MKRILPFLPLLFLAILLPVAAHAAPAPTINGTLDTIQNTFQVATGGWMTNAMVYAKDLFLGLAGIEFAWAAIQLTLKKGELPDFLASSTFKMLGIMFFYVLLVEAPTWIPAVMDSFSQAAGGISGSGVHAFTPSSVIDQGLSIAAQLITSMTNQASPGFGSIVATGGGALGKYLLSAIIIGLSGLVIVAAFTLVAVQLLVTNVESYIVIGGGALMLGFLGSRWTLPFGEKYFGYAISVGIKLFVLQLIVGLGGSVANALIQHLASIPSPSPFDYLAPAAASLGFGALGFMAPSLAGSMMNGSPALSMGNMAGAAAGIAGGIVGAGATMGAAAMGGASAASGIYAKTMGALKSGEKAAGSVGGSAMGKMVGGISGAPGGGGGTGGGISGAPSAPSAPPGMSGGAGGGIPATPASASAPSPAGAPEMSPAAPTAEGSSKISSGSGASAATPDVSAASAAVPSSTPELGVSDVKAKGGVDAITDPTKKPVAGAGMSDTADHLREMARRMNGLPAHDGHAGGVSIRLNHIE